jgi:hypothetical protein
MEHLFNSRALFALFLFVIWAVRAFKAVRDKAAAARGDQPVARGPHGEPVDPEAEERQRKVRAEVARKIAQRKILMMPSARLEPPPVPVSRTPPSPVAAPEDWAEPPPPPVRAPEPPPVRAPERPPVWASGPSPVWVPEQPAVWAPEPSPILASSPTPTLVPLTASQTALAEDFERWSAISPLRQGFGGQAGRVSLEDVRDPGALRRAVLMREILGPPVALR